MLKKIVCCCLVLVLAMAVGGCSAIDGLWDDFDHQAYVQSTLDALYKGITDEYAELTNSTKEEVLKLNEDKISSIAEVFIPNIENGASILFSQDQKTEIKELIKNYYKSASFETQNSKKIDANTYRVSIQTKVINSMASFNDNLDAFITEFDKKAENGELEGVEQGNLEATAKKIDALYTQGIVDVLKETVAVPSYGEEKTVTVDVKLDQEQNMWYISQDDLVKIETALIVL